MTAPPGTSVTDPGPTRRHPRLDELARLEANWDSYGAPPLTEAALHTADALVFVPIGDGGVGVELHAAGADIEIAIGPDGRVEGIFICGDVDDVEDDRPASPPTSGEGK